MAEVGATFVSVLPSARGFGKELDSQVGSEIEGSGVGGRAGKAFGAVGKAALVGLAAVGVGAAALATQVIGKFSELEQNLGGAEAVFGQYASTIVSKGAEAYRTLGLSQSDYLATANKMGSLFQGSGLAQQESLDLTSKAMQRAADMASVMGIDMSVAMESVAGAAKGNFTMMDNLGVAMNATTIEAYALEKGINFDWNTASQAEKSRVAMEMFFDRTSQYAGNFEREATQTISGSLGLLSAAWGSLVAGMGSADSDISQLTSNVVSAIGAVLDNVGPVLNALAANIPTVLTRLVGSLASIVPAVLELGVGVVTGLIDGIVQAAPGLVTVAVPILLSLVSGIVAQLPTILGAALQIVAALAQGIATALPTLIPVAMQAVVGLVDALIANLPLLLDAGLSLLGGLIVGILEAVPLLVAALPAVIDATVGFFTSAIPTIIEAGLGLLNGIVSAIPLVLPPLLAALPKVITTLIDFLIRSIPALVDGAVRMLDALVRAIPLIIPPLIAALPKIITALVGGLISAIPTLIQGAITLFLALVTALPQIIPQLVGAIPGVISALVGAIVGAVPQLVNAGVNLMRGFINGIVSMGSQIINAVKRTITDKLPGFVKSALGISSPSRVFAELGRFTGQGFENGLTESLEDAGEAAEATLADQMHGLARQAQAGVSGLDVSASITGANAMTDALASALNNANGSTGDVTINVSLSELEELVRLGDFATNLRRKVRQLGGVR